LGVSVSITNGNRIGKKGDKVHLLKIMVNSLDEKIKVLQNCTKLWNKNNPDAIQSIYISPVLTPKEQKENKIL